MYKKSNFINFTPITILKDHHHYVQMKKRVLFGRTALGTHDVSSYLDTPPQIKCIGRVGSTKSSMSDSSFLSYLNTPHTQIKSIGRIGG